MATFAGISLPKGTPEEICNAVEDAVLRASEQASFKDFMNSNGYGIDIRGTADFAAMLEEQNVLYAGAISLLG